MLNEFRQKSHTNDTESIFSLKIKTTVLKSVATRYPRLLLL
jgi:hypothetical protein